MPELTRKDTLERTEAEVRAAVDPTQMTDAEATKLGLKQYVADGSTTYNDGNTITVTSTSAGWSTTRATFIPYQTQDGSWRLKFNIDGDCSSASRGGSNVSVTGITSKTVDGTFVQHVDVSASVALSDKRQYIAENDDTFTVEHSTATTSGYRYQGEIELDSKPTWAY